METFRSIVQQELTKHKKLLEAVTVASFGVAHEGAVLEFALYFDRLETHHSSKQCRRMLRPYVELSFSALLQTRKSKLLSFQRSVETIKFTHKHAEAWM